jgi:ABC-type xylose transport system permease subunit
MDALLALEAGGFFDDPSVIDVVMALVNVLVLLIVLPWMLWGLWIVRPYCVLIGGIGTIAAGLFIVDRDTRMPCLLTGGALVLLGGAWIVRRRSSRSCDDDGYGP